MAKISDVIQINQHPDIGWWALKNDCANEFFLSDQTPKESFFKLEINIGKYVDKNRRY